MQKRVLDIGNCDLDHSSLTELITSNFDATVDRAHSSEDSLNLLGQQDYSLVIVNRLLDRDGSSGMDVIRQLKGEYPSLPVMMVTNFEEHQQAAVEIGSEPGFGKRELFSEPTIRLLANYLT